jgi:6-phosphogluconolactonase
VSELFIPKSERKQRLRFTLLQVASTLQPGDNRTEPNNHDLASEVELSGDGRFAYVSNRNTLSYNPDNIAIFSVNPQLEANHLTYLGKNSTHGKIPRHFSLSKDTKNKYIAVANEVTQDIMIFERNTQTGFMGRVVGKLVLGDLDITQQKGPTAVIWN